jgi:alkane 1-monooxygenase
MGSMTHALAFVTAYVVPLTAAVGLWLGGVWTFLTPLLVFGWVPLLDVLVDVDTENASPDEEARRLANPLYDVWLWLWIPAQLGLIAWGAHRVGSGAATLVEAAGVVLSVGIVGGAGGITIAHELMHRSTRREAFAAELLMSSVAYPHFCIEHVLGHHRWVATPLDPASSRLGESVYRFLPRVLSGSLASAWRLEGERVRRLGLPVWRDRRVRMPLVVLALWLVALLATGPAGLAFVVLQSVVAFGLLEIVNYVEHYGLERRRDAGGRWERVQPQHSWNSPHRVSGHLLFNLPRHADHHFLASRPYPILRHMPHSPQFPAGYGTMVLIGLVPPLWRRIMDPRVLAWRAVHAAPPPPVTTSIAGPAEPPARAQWT